MHSRSVMGVVACGLLIAGGRAGAAEVDRTSQAIYTREPVTLGQGQSIVILLQGNETLFTRMLEDALAIELSKRGVRVVDREIVAKVINGKVAGASGAKDGFAGVNGYDIAKALAANWMLTGTAVLESDEPLGVGVRAISVQLADPAKEALHFGLVSQFTQRLSLADAARKIVDSMVATRGGS